jgi:3-oxoacyl-[acyl-carrier protein] reductase
VTDEARTGRLGLERRVAVVTAGAGIGIGGSIVRRLVSEGAIVCVSDAHEGRLQRIGAELGVHTSLVDVAVPGALEAHLGEVASQHGHIDILVNCAGANIVKPVTELTIDEWHHVFGINLDAPFRAVRTVLPGMLARDSGTIVNIASIAAWDPMPNEVAYSTSKAALIAFTRAVARELATTSVRINAIAPSLVENPFLEKLYGPEKMASLRADLPRGRGVLPEEVASVAAFLAGEDSSYVTGETITVAGGSNFRS